MTDAFQVRSNESFYDLQYPEYNGIVDTKTSKNSIVCVLCYKILANPEDYAAHQKEYHGLGVQSPRPPSSAVSSLCAPKNSCKLESRDMHSSEVWLLQCTLCGHYTDTPLDTGTFVCARCNQESIPLMNPKLMTAHLWAEPMSSATTPALTGTDSYTCARCHQSFSSQIAMRDHRISEHPQHYAAYLCRHNRCWRKFLKFEHFIRHQNEDHKLKHTCELCEKSFTATQTLRQHMRTHTGEKPFRCAECGKAFAVKDYLNKHIRVHTGEKPYECRLCNARFTQQTAMTLHMRNSCPVKNDMPGAGMASVGGQRRRRKPVPTLLSAPSSGPVQLDPAELFKGTKLSDSIKRRK